MDWTSTARPPHNIFPADMSLFYSSLQKVSITFEIIHDISGDHASEVSRKGYKIFIIKALIQLADWMRAF
jgi:hypothetical protein